LDPNALTITVAARHCHHQSFITTAHHHPPTTISIATTTVTTTHPPTHMPPPQLSSSPPISHSPTNQATNYRHHRHSLTRRHHHQQYGPEHIPGLNPFLGPTSASFESDDDGDDSDGEIEASVLKELGITETAAHSNSKGNDGNSSSTASGGGGGSGGRSFAGSQDKDYLEIGSGVPEAPLPPGASVVKLHRDSVGMSFGFSMGCDQVRPINTRRTLPRSPYTTHTSLHPAPCMFLLDVSSLSLQSLLFFIHATSFTSFRSSHEAPDVSFLFDVSRRLLST
jgi:hypothetical protein